MGGGGGGQSVTRRVPDGAAGKLFLLLLALASPPPPPPPAPAVSLTSSSASATFSTRVAQHTCFYVLLYTIKLTCRMVMKMSHKPIKYHTILVWN